LAELARLEPAELVADVPPAGGGSKWSQVTAAIDHAALATDRQISWGLELFPSDADCGTSTSVAVPVAAGAGSAIAQAIGSNTLKLRLLVQVFGVLLDGTRVRGSTYEYVVQADPTFVLPQPACTAPAVAVACEGVNQDPGTGCQ